jgi:ABC-type polysaccharide/polyol phosphate transport system ATPase subunit
MPRIQVDDVSKAFLIPSVRRDTVREHFFGVLHRRQFQRLQVLNSIGFELRDGEALGILGRNGTGKSTLLKIICGIYLPDTGRVNVKGGITPILELGLGWNGELDAVDNVFLIGSIMGMSLRELRGSMDEILQFAELERFANLKLKHYSSGMASRLAYSVAFRAVRDTLVLDEIFAVGDVGFRQRCEERYRQFRRAGHAALIVSHDPRIISTFCDRALVLDNGRIVAEGPAAEITDAYVERLVSDARRNFQTGSSHN